MPFQMHEDELSQETTATKFATVQIGGGREPTISKMETVGVEVARAELTTTEVTSVVQN